jgi:stage V sporulation protein SpoVS
MNMQEGVKGMKNNGQLFQECHESICKKLWTDHPVQMTNIFDEVVEYLTFLRKMRPNDNSISFIDNIKKGTFSLQAEIAERGLEAVNDYIKAVNIARDYFKIEEHSDKSVTSLVGMNNTSFVKEKFIEHVAYCYNQLKKDKKKNTEDNFLADLKVLTQKIDDSVSELRDKYKLSKNDFSYIGGTYSIDVDSLR